MGTILESQARGSPSISMTKTACLGHQYLNLVCLEGGSTITSGQIVIASLAGRSSQRILRKLGEAFGVSGSAAPSLHFPCLQEGRAA